MANINHIALIPDGARRWARRENVALKASYGKSVALLTSYIDTLFSLGVDVVTVYLLSKENLKRSPEELSAALSQVERFVRENVPELCDRLGTDARIAGAVDLLPAPWRGMGSHLLDTGTRSAKRLNLCIAYDPLLELWSVINKKESSSSETLMSCMWVADRVDLLIRTGGARTLSNFVPLQCGYAQLVFLDELFNDTSLDQMLRIVEQHRNLDVKIGW
jgi:short-chain Z-isoprenyl diphosphate synthase